MELRFGQPVFCIAENSQARPKYTQQYHYFVMSPFRADFYLNGLQLRNIC